MTIRKRIRNAKRSPAKRLVPLQGTERLPLYRIKVPANFKDLLVGYTLGNRYWVLSVIGKGGMSVVYKAKAKDTNEIVAVKTLRTSGLTDEMLVKRFQREAELLSRLNHPRIVNLHAYGTSARGQPYFVMDFLQGKDLTEVLKVEDHLVPERFQDIFVQVCAAVEHAHKHNAIHRDIKPGNIMLTKQGRTKDYVKIVDFGIAMITEEAQRLTRMGEVWGSPIYMSPEQCMGANVDFRSDIYSLGIVMYESLTGKVPFLGRNYADTMGKQISEPPPPFKEARPDLDIPESMEKIVMRALAKQPEDRYQSLTQMRKDLEAALSYNPKPQTKAEKTEEKTTAKKLSKTNLRAMQGPAVRDREREPVKRETNSNKREPGKVSGRKKTREVTVDYSEPKGRPRWKTLSLVVAGALAVSAGIITVVSHADAVTKIMADMARTLLKDSTDSHQPLDLIPGQEPGASTQEPIDPNKTAVPGGGEEQKPQMDTEEETPQQVEAPEEEQQESPQQEESQ